MKRILTLVLTLALTFTLCSVFTGCGSSDDGKNTSSTAANSGETAKATLKVGMECNYAPFNWTQTDNSNNAVAIDGTAQFANGYDVQIAKKIADSLNRELVVVKMTWDGLIPAVQSGAIDMIIAGMSPTAERKESIDFSDAYYVSNLVVVVNKSSKFASAKSIKDFNGAKIVGQKGTFHETVISQMPGVTQVTSMKDFSEMIVALKSGAIDGYIAEKPGAIGNCEANSEFAYVDLANNDTGFKVADENVQIAVGLKKNSDLTAKINTALAAITTEQRDSIMQNAIDQQPEL